MTTYVDTQHSNSQTNGDVTTTLTTYLRIYIDTNYSVELTTNPSFQFDQGSYNSTSGANPMRIVPIEHWSGMWAWFCLRSTDLGGTTPHFLATKTNHYYIDAGERLAVWATSPDTDDWYDFDHVTTSGADIEFYNDSPFPAGNIYIASLPMYPFSRVQRRMTQLSSQDARVVDTPSTTNFILDTMTARSTDDGSGRTAPALPMYGFKLTNNSGFTKNKAILTAHNHPSETPGPFALEGAVDWLLSGAAHAETLLNWFEFYIYPCLNPQGVWSGYFRSCPENKTLDHNRQWLAGGLEDVDAYKTAFTADTGGAIEVGIDFHSWMEYIGIFGITYNNAEALHAAFKAEMLLLDAGYGLNTDTTSTMLANVFRSDYSARLAISQECGGAITRFVPEYKIYGENTMKALYELLADGLFTNHP